MKDHEVKNLARRDIEVLAQLHDYTDGGKRAVPASRIRDALAWADDNQHIRYRFDKLEDEGLVESWKADEDTPGAQVPPRVAKPTNEGVELAEEIELQKPADTLERIERVEKQLARMRETYGQVKQRIVEVEQRVDELEGDVDDDLEDLAEDVRNIKRSLDGGPLIDADEMTFDD
ncbi:hypothetical protein ACLI4Z_09075 [Natrialbaceae archaeon A-arb3/5]